jgi:hypothetical protein
MAKAWNLARAGEHTVPLDDGDSKQQLTAPMPDA